jgi:hypothetical protein
MRGWQEELQWGVFMIVCLRCHPDDVKALKTQRQVTQTLQHADFSKQVQGSRVGEGGGTQREQAVLSLSRHVIGM